MIWLPPPSPCWKRARSPGEHFEYYTQPIWLDKSNASGGNCFALPKTAATSPVPMAPDKK